MYLESCHRFSNQVAQCLHLGAARHAHVEIRVAAESGEGHVGRSGDGRARLRVALIPGQIRLGRKVLRSIEFAVDLTPANSGRRNFRRGAAAFTATRTRLQERSPAWNGVQTAGAPGTRRNWRASSRTFQGRGLHSRGTLSPVSTRSRCAPLTSRAIHSQIEFLPMKRAICSTSRFLTRYVWARPHECPWPAYPRTDFRIPLRGPFVTQDENVRAPGRGTGSSRARRGVREQCWSYPE